ncbi:MAG: PIG-L deacetylase family protein [Promethearchaeota archaeon]
MRRRLERQALVIVPHEDDMEFLCFHFVNFLVERGFKIREIVMTDGRFGTRDHNFSGKRLMKLREKEVKMAAKVFNNNNNNRDGCPAVEVSILGYCDGFIPVSNRVAMRLKNIIEKLKPSIVIAPDPIFAIDWHHDHIATGRNVYLALKKIPEAKRPKLCFFFQTFKGDTRVPFAPVSLQLRALSKYRSQVTPLHLKNLKFMGKFLELIAKIKGRGRPYASYRKISFNSEENRVRSLSDFIKYLFFFHATRSSKYMYSVQYKPLPDFEDKDEDLKREDFDADIWENMSEFYFGKRNNKKSK